MKAAYAVLGVLLFILGLRMIVGGAGSLKGLLQALSVEGIPGGLGLGWLMACVILSGSPVAATALALHTSTELDFDSYETFAMINGSRLGASFVVLLIGFIYDVRGRKHQNSVYVGTVALLTTLTTYTPAMFLGFVILSRGLLSGVRPPWAGHFTGLLDTVYNPILEPLKRQLPGWALAITGILVLLLAFKIFDLALPEMDPFHGSVARMANVVYRPSYTFLLGMLVTCLTLSVSVSVSILVPLTAKGYVRRENLIPYIMGANITTWVDTLFFSLMLKSSDAFEIVLVEMLVGIVVTLPLILLAYGWYERIIDRSAVFLTVNKLRLALFVAFFLAVPLVLLFL